MFKYHKKETFLGHLDPGAPLCEEKRKTTLGLKLVYNLINFAILYLRLILDVPRVTAEDCKGVW